MSQGKIDLEMNNVPLGVAVARLIDTTGLNIIVARGVSGNLSGKLKNIPVVKGLKALFASNGFELVQKDGVYFVSKRSV